MNSRNDRRGGGYNSGGNYNSGGGYNSRDFAPVQVGEEIDVKIEAVGEKGDGIARKNGFVLFVPSTNEGDEVRVKVTKVLRKVGFAEVIGAAQSTPAESRPKKSREDVNVVPKEQDGAPEDSESFGEEKPDEDELDIPPPPEEDSEDE